MPRLLTVLDTAIGASPRVTVSIAPTCRFLAPVPITITSDFSGVEDEVVLRKPSVDCKETIVQPGQVVVPQFDVELGIVSILCVMDAEGRYYTSIRCDVGCERASDRERSSEERQTHSRRQWTDRFRHGRTAFDPPNMSAATEVLVR